MHREFLASPVSVSLQVQKTHIKLQKVPLHPASDSINLFSSISHPAALESADELFASRGAGGLIKNQRRHVPQL
jgi:hypothetical protein